MSFAPRMLRDLVGADCASIVDVWRARVAATPEAVFLIDGDRRWTYGESWEQIRNVAAHLQDREIRLGDRVAGFLSNRPETLWLWFAVNMIGCVYVPLNRSHKGIILADMIERAGASLLVSEMAAQAVLPLKTPPLMLVEDFYDTAAREADIEAPDPFSLACVMYTSGVTGKSKAVRLRHVLFAHQAARIAEAWRLTSSSVFHGWLPLFHIAGLLHQTFATVVAGGAVALYPTFSASRFRQQVIASGATIAVGLPNVVNILWNASTASDDASWPLRLMISTAVNPDLQAGFEQRFGLRLLEQYGMTEAELITLPTPEETLPPLSCGRPGPDWDVIVADANDRPLPSGVIGEILCRPRVSGILMDGYDHDPVASADALRNAWFHTGDYGKLDSEGYLFFCDRRKHVIRRRSENISSIELERIVEQHPDVDECAAIGVPAPLGEDDVMIFVTAKAGKLLSAPGLHAFCHEQMARFMVPRYIAIVEEFPRTDVGKIAKDRLDRLSVSTWDAERAGG